MQNIDVHVGKRLRGRRTILGLSQGDVANRLGVTFQQVQKYEKGASGLNARRLLQLSDSLGISVAYFFEGLEGEPTAGEGADAGRRIEHHQPVSERETLELAKAFTQIRDRRLRRCLAGLMRDLADAA